MSSKKGSQDNITTKETVTATPVSSQKSLLEEQHQSVNETLDETKNNINKVIGMLWTLLGIEIHRFALSHRIQQPAHSESATSEQQPPTRISGAS